jgi:CubicO group peptidase (beta-lactamase class C family)
MIKLAHLLCVFLVFISCRKKSTDLTPAVVDIKYDFSEVDNLLNQNLQNIYKGSVFVNVNKDGKAIYTRGLGGFSENTTKLVASCTKTFAGVVVLSLVDDGVLSLDDSIGRFLPIFTKYKKGNCTIRQCFSHTGGWDDTGDTYIGVRTFSLAQSVDEIAKNVNYAYKPGTTFDYGGVSMQIVGRVAEVASKKPWNQLFKEKVVDKLELKDSDFTFVTDSNPRVAGGMMSSPADIIKLSEMILNKGLYKNTRVLSEKTWNELWKDQTNGAKIVYTPYPTVPNINNPYNVSEVRYSIGAWLDVQNPTTKYVEQISGDGAFGTSFWIDRCRNITGVIFTFSSFKETGLTNFKIEDAVRKQVGGGCK